MQRASFSTFRRLDSCGSRPRPLLETQTEVCDTQKASLSPNLICRSPNELVISLKPFRSVMAPVVELILRSETFAPGLLKCGVLVKLNDSARNWMLYLSLNLNSRKRPK